MSLSYEFWDTILKVRKTRSRNQKEVLLARHRNSATFKKVLYLTYSPFIRFHIRKIPSRVRGRGWAELGSETWSLLNKLALRKLTGIAARESLFEHMENLSAPACEIVRLIIKKDLKCGAATTTINKVFGKIIPTFECQLVEDWEDNRVRYPILMGPKVDCVRGEYRSGGFFTRRGHEIVGVDHVSRYIEKIGSHMELSGELYIPGYKFHRASGIIRSNKPQKLNVRFAIFDIRSMSDKFYTTRHKYLSKTFYPIGTNPAPEAVYIPHVLIYNKDQAVAYFNRCVRMGFEGAVGKDPNGMVEDGRSYSWVRMVNGITLERKIINVYESEEVPGTMGGVIVEGGIKLGSGFTQRERELYFKQPGMILGKYATIIAKEKTKSGSLRQPIYKGIRWDIDI